MNSPRPRASRVPSLRLLAHARAPGEQPQLSSHSIDATATSACSVQVSRAATPEVFNQIVLDDSKLVWKTDRDTFFSNYSASNHNTIPSLRGGKQLTLGISQDEHFMAWMRPSAHPSAPCLSLLVLVACSRQSVLVATCGLILAHSRPTLHALCNRRTHSCMRPPVPIP
jgi:hypothetical protein